MTKLPLIIFFSKKSLILFPCLPWPLSLYNTVKQPLQGNIVKQSLQSLRTPFWVLNSSFAPNKNFFEKASNIICMYLLAPFIVQNFLEPIPSYQDVCFQAQNSLFALNKSFLVKIITATFIYVLAPSITQYFKKILRADPEF